MVVPKIVAGLVVLVTVLVMHSEGSAATPPVSSLPTTVEVTRVCPCFECPCITEQRLRFLLSRYDWDVDTMLYIAKREGGYNPSTGLYYFGSQGPVNFNGTVDRCGFQVNSIHGFNIHKLLNYPRYCVGAAYEVWRGSGRRYCPTFYAAC